MSKIIRVIQPDYWELVRDRIANILNDEIATQVQLTYDMYLAAKILIEDINPIDQTYNPTINVSFAQGSYDNKSVREVKGTYTYFIDCYAHAKTTVNNTGDYLAAKRTQKLMRLCRSILNDPIYRTLGYVPGFVYRVYISQTDIRTVGKGDAYNSFMGRVTFNVEVQEPSSLIIPSLIEGYDTQVQLNNTIDGYAWTINNDY